MTAPARLRFEHLDGAVLGLGVTRPRLSWQLPPGTARQVAHVVEVDGRAYGRAVSDASVLVPWPAPPLTSRQRATWRVKVWTEAGESDWSAPAWCETGLLEPSDWTARFIEPYETERSAHLLRHAFRLHAPPADARLYATAHGIYETFLNGRRVGDVELAPGFTSYPTTLHVQAYDVTDLLVVGDNHWEVVLSDGWWRGRTGFFQARDGYGTTLGFLGQLHAGDTVVTTDADWESSTGPVRSADLMAGQTEDHRTEPHAWHAVTVADYDLGNLSYSPAPPTRSTQELRPVSVTRLQSERHVVDLGQNINGWLRLSDLGPEGTELTLVHGESLDQSGDVTQDHLHPSVEFPGMPSEVGMIDHVVAAGTPGEVFEPRQTTHGFQFARIEGHPGPLTVDDVTGVVVHTDLRRTGWFRCSDERLNRFHDITDWSFRDNACEIPTDCPQRERAGWAGDWQLFIPTAAFLYDVAGFSLRWMRDLAAEQLDNGCVTNYVPDGLRRRAEVIGTLWTSRQGSSGWGDAMVMVPWEMWRAYGDTDVLAELWPHMTAWVDFAATTARTQRHPSRVEARPEPLPHEQYLWDGGYHWGEWLEPGAVADSHMGADHGAVATAFLHHSAGLLARIGRLLGHDAEAEPLRGAGGKRARGLAHRVHRSRWRVDTRHPGQPRARPRLRPGVRRAASPDGGPPGRADPPSRHAPGHRFPGHALPAARAGRHRTPRRRLPAPPAGHAALVALHGRVRSHDGLGALGRGRCAGLLVRLAQPLQQGSRHLLPAQLRGGHNPARRRRAPGLPALPGRASPRWWTDLGRGGA